MKPMKNFHGNYIIKDPTLKLGTHLFTTVSFQNLQNVALISRDVPESLSRMDMAQTVPPGAI